MSKKRKRLIMASRIYSEVGTTEVFMEITYSDGTKKIVRMGK